jgi:hypothetical protein
MSLTSAAIRLMAQRGLSASDIADIAEANEPARTSGAARQKRYRDNKRNERDVTRNVTPPPNDINSNPPFDVSSETSAVSDFGDRVVDAWNAGIEGTALPAARKLNPDRRKHLTARAREHGEEAVFAAISNMQRSDFHSGRDGKWTEGNLGWLLKSPENFQKMLERTNAQPPGSPQSNLAILGEQARRYRQPQDQAA